MNVNLKALGVLGLAAGLSSCAAVDSQNNAAPAAGAPIARTEAISQISLPPASDDAAARERQALIDEINRDGRSAGFTGYRQAGPQPAQQPAQNVVALNYEQADLRDILSELADALDISMVIDPTIADKVSLRTAQNRPLTFNDIWPLMNLLARENGVTLEQVGNIWYARKSEVPLAPELTTP
ncbi:MAG TPA: hypothetical protein VKZ92_07700, partial [Pseudohongiella sp.]|nr:hypothetical protein [Pseudohongiella sp.]